MIMSWLLVMTIWYSGTSGENTVVQRVESQAACERIASAIKSTLNDHDDVNYKCINIYAE